MAEPYLNSVSYCKLILHAAKYPHCAVNGVLLTDKSKNKDLDYVNIVDAVPLFHLSLGLSPMMEVALTQIDAYCKNKNLAIAGYYQANENYHDTAPTSIAFRIADRIHDHFDGACLIMVENEKLSGECEEEAIDVYRCYDNKWKLTTNSKELLEADTLANASVLLHTKAYRQLIDFDNHLDNISLDWRNTQIEDAINRAT